MENDSDSIFSHPRIDEEESKIESRVLEGHPISSTTATERTTEKEPENVYSIAHLQQYITVNVEQKQSLGPIDQVVTACRIDNDQLLVAAGCDDGVVRLYMTDNGKYFGQVVFTEEPGNAVLDLKWRPTHGNDMTEHVFLASDVFGNIYHVHATSKKILHKLREEGNQAYAVDYNNDGSKFATGGKDCKIRVYDEQKKSHCEILQTNMDIPIHENRIQSLKFAPDSPNLLVSGSWDETVKIWDLRVGGVIKSIYGMKVYGDGLDIQENVILTGHNRDKKQLQLWDLGTQKLIEDIAWDPVHDPTAPLDASITVARFSKCNYNYIVAFSGILKQFRVFDRKNGNRLCYVGFTKGEVNTADFYWSNNSFIYGGSCGELASCRLS